jgi:hypothetical protein
MRTIPEKATPRTRPSKEDKIAYGEYLVIASACADCHTKFEKGKFIGEQLAGGREFVFPDGSVLRTSNLTPHNTTGIGAWSKEMFVDRFKMYSETVYEPPTGQTRRFSDYHALGDVCRYGNGRFGGHL